MTVSGDLARRVAHTDPRLLVPAGGVAPDRLDVVDAWELPAGGPPLSVALAQDAEQRWHVLPLVDDATGLRRAREGDGLAAGIVAQVAAASGDETTKPGGFHVRARTHRPPELGGYVRESTAESSPVHEVTMVGDSVRVRLDLMPTEAFGPRFDVISHLRASGFTVVGRSAGDVIWIDGDRWVAPIAGIAEPLAGMPLDEAFGRAAARHLRGGTDAEPTLHLASGLARLLAALHVALATPTAEWPVGTSALTEVAATEMARSARDAVAEAVVLTDDDTQRYVRARRDVMREAFAPLSEAAGTALLPAAPFTLLPQAFVDEAEGGGMTLDPLQLTSAESPRPAVADIAGLLRGLNHVAHGALRRLVGGGESVPVERVRTWAIAVREELLAEYRAALAEADMAWLFDEQLLLGLEIEAECRALSYAARNLSTWSTVPNAGLLELLPRE